MTKLDFVVAKNIFVSLKIIFKVVLPLDITSMGKEDVFGSSCCYFHVEYMQAQRSENKLPLPQMNNEQVIWSDKYFGSKLGNM